MRSSTLASTAVALAAAVAACSAHMCLLEPVQRDYSGAAPTKAFDPRCGLTTSPCGGEAAGAASATYKRGQLATVGIQKNANHFPGSGGGNFTVAMWQGGNKLGDLAVLYDSNTTALTEYKVTVPVGDVAGTFTLEAVYNTDNTAAPPQFFQCADISIE